jgi:hypothetical protein
MPTINPFHVYVYVFLTDALRLIYKINLIIAKKTSVFMTNTYIQRLAKALLHPPEPKNCSAKATKDPARLIGIFIPIVKQIYPTILGILNLNTICRTLINTNANEIKEAIIRLFGILSSFLNNKSPMTKRDITANDT